MIPVVLDENISVRVARSLKDLRLEVVHMTDLVQRGTADVTWADLVAKRGFRLVVSTDSHLTKRSLEVEALKRNRLGVLVLRQRDVLRVHHQALFILRAWDDLQAKATRNEDHFFVQIGKKGLLTKWRGKRGR